MSSHVVCQCQLDCPDCAEKHTAHNLHHTPEHRGTGRMWRRQHSWQLRGTASLKGTLGAALAIVLIAVHVGATRPGYGAAADADAGRDAQIHQLQAEVSSLRRQLSAARAPGPAGGALHARAGAARAGREGGPTPGRVVGNTTLWSPLTEQLNGWVFTENYAVMVQHPSRRHVCLPRYHCNRSACALVAWPPTEARGRGEASTRTQEA